MTKEKKPRIELIEDEANDINEYDIIMRAADHALELVLKYGWHVSHGPYEGPEKHRVLLHDKLYWTYEEAYLRAVNSDKFGVFKCKEGDDRFAVLKQELPDGQISYKTICFLGHGI